MRKVVYSPNDTITGPEAIKILGLSKTDYLKPLCDKKLLYRWKFSRREVKYSKKQCEALFQRKMKEEVSYSKMIAA